MTLYFERHDGQAVTCDDFAQAIADANPMSDLARLLPQFKRWYSQAGTPRVQAQGAYDAAARTYTLTLSQSCCADAGPAGQGAVRDSGRPGPAGRRRPATCRCNWRRRTAAVAGTRTVVLTQASESFTFVNLDAEPVPSILRGFTAPVVLEFDYTDAQLLHLLAHDSDPFNRWEAGQRLAVTRRQRYQIHS